MKRCLTFLKCFLITLATTLAFGTTVFAWRINVEVNGEPVVFKGAEPFVDSNGRTLVPLAPIAEALGMYTTWDAGEWFSGEKKVDFVLEYTESNSPVKDSSGGYIKWDIFTFRIDNNMFEQRRYLSNSDEPEILSSTMDTAPIIVNSRTYAPVRYLANAAGYNVDWDADTKTVIIYTKDAEKPPVSMPDSGAYLEQGDMGDIGKKFSTYMFDFTVNSVWKGEEYEGYTAAPGNILYVVKITETNTFYKKIPIFANKFYLRSSSFNGYEERVMLTSADIDLQYFPMEVGQTVIYYITFEVSKDVADLELFFSEEKAGNLILGEYVVKIK